jgi:hypothetical protein
MVPGSASSLFGATREELKIHSRGTCHLFFEKLPGLVQAMLVISVHDESTEDSVWQICYRAPSSRAHHHGDER